MLPRFASTSRVLAVVGMAVFLAAVATATAASGPARTVRVSVSPHGDQADRTSGGPSLSQTGRFVAFASWGHLVPGDTNGQMDVFVRDLTARKTKRVSLSSRGRQGNERSNWASISSDGRFVAFQSKAGDLASGDRDKGWDVFVRDLKRNTTTLASIQPGGRHGGVSPSISADGRSVAFEGATAKDGTNGVIFVRDLRAHRTERVPAPSSGGRTYGGSRMPALSGDGHLVAFASFRDFDTPIPRGGSDVFVRNMNTDKTQLVSVSPHPQQTEGYSGTPCISADGRFVAFVSFVDMVSGDPNGKVGIFRRDLVKQTNERINVSSNGDVADNGGFSCAMAANGRFVAFGSYATNLVPDDTNEAQDIFVRDVAGRTTTRVSVSDSGEQATSTSGSSFDADSLTPAISGDGRFAGFQSRAPNLVEDDTNGNTDVFVRGPLHP